MNPLISVIVPVYNSEDYLSDCLDSILKQSEENIEVIIIDDGSTDTSPEICDRYAGNDKRISVVHKKNEGTSIARNEGLHRAKGEYVAFVDSDDILESNMLQDACSKASEHNADLVVWNYCFLFSDGTIERNIDFPNSTTIIGSESIGQAIATTLCPLITDLKTPRNKIIGMGFLWNKLFKASIIRDNGLLFDEGIVVSEDIVFVCKYLSYCESIDYINDCNYFYRVVASGATLRYKPEIAKSNDKLFVAMVDSLQDMTDLQKAAFFSRVIRGLSNVAMFYCFHKNFRGPRLRRFIEIINSNEYYKEAIERVDKKHLTTKQKVMIALIKMLPIKAIRHS